MAKDKRVGLIESREAIANIRPNSDRYSRLGLTNNPFPAGGLAPSNPQIEPWPEVRYQIRSFIESFFHNGSSKGLLLLGNYGAGKTYHLNYIRTILEHAKFKLRIVHAVDPGVHPYHLIRSMLLNIGEEEIATMIWAIIGPYLKQQFDNNPGFFDAMVRPSALGKKYSPSVAQQTLNMITSHFNEETWSDHREFIRSLDRQMLIDREKLVASVTPLLQHELQTDIKQIADDLAGVCLYYGLPALERWKLLTEGVGQGSIQAGNESDFLSALLHLLRRNGVEYFILLLDEFEKVPQLQRMTERDARLYLDTLRMLIDAGHKHLSFAYVLASNPDAWRIAIETNASLEDRFEIVNLPSMIADNIAIYTIQSYLSLARLNGSQNTDTLEPFPDNFLELIPAGARVTARQLLKLCYSLIELAVDNFRSTIDDDLIQIALQRLSSQNYLGSTDTGSGES